MTQETFGQTLSWSSGDVNNPEDGAEYKQFAEEALQALWNHYPGYSWHIQIGGGVLMIKNLTLDWKGRWGMVLDFKDVAADHARLVRSVVNAAGEFLERANKKRGANDGEPVTGLDGAGQKWSPIIKPDGMIH